MRPSDAHAGHCETSDHRHTVANRLHAVSLHLLIKEMWVNVLEHGGHQAIRSYANSFISGIIYLTKVHPSSHTVFHKNLGGNDFVFSNYNANATIGPFNGNRWVVPKTVPGDLMLFPSYLLHEVPKNLGERRLQTCSVQRRRTAAICYTSGIGEFGLR